LKNNKRSKISESLDVLIDLIPDPVVVIDVSGKVLASNKMIGKFAGYNKKELSGKSFLTFKFINEENKRLIAKNLKDRIAGSPIPPYNIKLVAKNGEVKCLKISGNRFMHEGEPLDLVIFYDITEENKIQNELRKGLLESQEKIQGINNSIKEAIIVVDNQAKVTYWNPAAEKVFGYTIEEVFGKNIHDLVVPISMCKEGKERIAMGVKTFAQTGLGYFAVCNVELVGRRKDSSEFPAELSISPTRLGGNWAAVGVVKDITRRKAEEQKLRDTEQRYHAIFNQAPLGVLVVDPETAGIFEFNDIAHQQLGYSREEFEKLTLLDIEAKKSTDQVKAHLKEMLEVGKSEFETLLRMKNGEIANSWVTTRVFRSGGKLYLLCVYRDITEIKKAQQALTESEELSRAIVANAPIGIATSDKNYHFITANEAFCSILGYSEEELRKLTFKDITHPDDLQESIDKVNDLQKGRIPFFMKEKRYIRKDGTVIIGKIFTNMIRNQTDKPPLFIVELEDITKKKELEDDLRSSEERFRAISASAMDTIVLSDEEENIIYWNPAAEKMFGFCETEAMGRKLATLIIPPLGYEKHRAMLKELREHNLAKKNLGYLALKKDGSLFPMELSVISVKIKDRNCLLSVIRNITESKAMEEALKQERDMLENMATNIDAGLAIIGKDYRVIWANRRLIQAGGSATIENKPCYTLFNNDSKTGICEDCGVKKIFEKGASIDRHDFHFKRGGLDKWFEIIATPVKDKDGKVTAALELAVDITERKRLQKRLSDYSQRLEELVQQRTEQLKKTQAELVKSERLAAIGELAGMVGHDLRNPLTGIKNSAYFMKKKGSNISPNQAMEMLDTIDKCVNYSNKIVNDLLDYSKEVHLELREESLRKLLTESLALLDVSEKVQVSNRLSDEPKVRIDIDKMKRVFVNLVKNALDAMPKGGKIIVDSNRVGQRLDVSFTDTGEGIPDDVLPKLFSPLFTTKAQGMGFGLAICKRIIEAHRGTILVNSAKGKGTTFTLTLPIESKFEVGGENEWISIPESL
jgi:PAS domain S-box-containing protein